MRADANRGSGAESNSIDEQDGGGGGILRKGKHLAGSESGEAFQGNLQSRHGEFEGERTFEQLLLNLEAGFDGTATPLVAEVGGNFSEQGIRYDGGDGEVEGAAGLRHFDFEAEAKIFFFGGHEAWGLEELLAGAEIEFERDRVPAGLQLAQHDADNAFENLFFYFGDVALNFAGITFPAKHDFDNGKGNSEIELEHGGGADRGEFAGSEVGLFGKEFQEFAVGEMLGGYQAAVENDAQVAADGGGEAAGKVFVELVDGAQLLASDLSRLTDVPG